MQTAVRALALASLLLVPAPGEATAPSFEPDTAALQFLGFRAGARLDELALQLRRSGGGRIQCRRAKVDRRVTDCRAALKNPEASGSLELWISAIDSVAGVITLSSVVAPGHLERWRDALEQRYGQVPPRIQGTQTMLQWVRRGRMLRLTWRMERGEQIASVSLVDGHVLDDWARGSPAPAQGRPDAPAVLHPDSRTR